MRMCGPASGDPIGCNRFSFFVPSLLDFDSDCHPRVGNPKTGAAVRPWPATHRVNALIMDYNAAAEGRCPFSALAVAVAVSEVKWSAVFCRLRDDFLLVAKTSDSQKEGSP